MTRFVPTVVLVACAAVGAARGAEHTADSLDTVKKNLAAGKAVLVDVREPGEWADGHLKDAKPLPLSQIKRGVPADTLASTIPTGAVVYLHCASGFRCKAAADHLKKLGYDVRPLATGYDDLVQSGFPAAK